MAVAVRKSYLLDEFRLEPDLLLLHRNGDEIHLAHRPFQVLLYLLENRDRVVSRAELLEKFWGSKDVYDETLTKCIGAIRRSLQDTSDHPRFIETHYAGGYRYVGPFEIKTTHVTGNLIGFEKTRGVKILIEEETNGEETIDDPDSKTLTLAEKNLPQMKTVKSVEPRIRTFLSRRVLIPALIVLAIVLITGILFYNLRQRESNVIAKSSASVTSRSIAVMPLKNLTGDPNNDYFTDGVTESLITELSKIKELKVISRSSVFIFKDKAADPREVGQHLGVATLLEGHVQKNGDAIRVVVRLISTEDGRVLWTSDSFDRSLKDVLEIQDEIACNVATELRSQLCDSEPQLAKHYTNNTDAYQAFLRGRFHLNKRTSEGIKKAIENFEQAVNLDPNYALAYSNLAKAYKLGVWYIPIPASKAMPKIRAAARKAIELDNQLAEAHIAMAEVYSFDWDFRKAINEHEQAIRLNPGDGDLHHSYALGIALLGRFDQAITEIKRAQELDPLSLIISTDAGWIYYLAHCYDEAITQYKKALELDSNFTLARFDLALAYSQKGMPSEAIAEMLKAETRGSEYLAGLGYVYAVAGQRDKALQTLNELENFAKKQYVPPYHFVWIYVGLGEKEKAIELLEQVFNERTQHVVDFKVHPMLDPLRNEPKFQSLVQRVGLPD